MAEISELRYKSKKKLKISTVIRDVESSRDDKYHPEWDLVKGEPILNLMRVHRELLTADADLSAKRIEHRHRRESADKQWEDLREKQKKLRLSFIKFDEFVKENREKRERALRKIQDEKECQKIRDAEIFELEKNLEYIEKIRDKMQKQVNIYKPFQEYLETVLETNEFKSIADIFNRYETLIDARNSLIEHQDQSLHTLEDTSVQLQKMNEDKSQSLMDLNSRLATLQSRHERGRANALHWETVISRIKEVTSRKELEETQVRSCIWNLYRQICKRKGVPVEAKREELEKQLVDIKRTILQLAKIVRAAKLKAAKQEKVKEQYAEGKSLTSSPTRDVNKTSFRSNRSSFRSYRTSFRSNRSSFDDSRSVRRN